MESDRPAGVSRAWRRRALLSGVLACGLLAGCATPNLKPFADATAALGTAVAGEQREVSQKFQKVAAEYQSLCDAAGAVSCDAADERRKQRARYEESRRLVDTLLQKATAYAITLAELAQAGEEGPKAAEALLGTVKQFGAIVPVGVPTAAAAKALEEVARVAQRVQAQDSLKAATSHAQPAVDVLADAIVAIYADAEPWVRDGLADDLYALPGLSAGTNLMGAYAQASASREDLLLRIRRQGAALNNLPGCATASGKDLEDCRSLATALSSAEDVGRLLDRLRPRYEAAIARRAAAVQWREQRIEAGKAVTSAAAAWKGEHRRISEHLQRCAGFSAYRCVEINAGTIRSFVDRLDEVREKAKR